MIPLLMRTEMNVSVRIVSMIPWMRTNWRSCWRWDWRHQTSFPSYRAVTCRRHSAGILTGLVLKPLRQMLQEAALSSLPKRSLEVRLLCAKKKMKKQRGRCEQIPRILNPQLFSPLRGSETDTNYRECAPLNSALSSSSNNRFWERPFKCLMWVINSYSVKQSCLQEWKTVIPLHGWQAIFLCQGLFLHI